VGTLSMTIALVLTFYSLGLYLQRYGRLLLRPASAGRAA
jgi:hypothetical protein